MASKSTSQAIFGAGFCFLALGCSSANPASPQADGGSGGQASSLSSGGGGVAGAGGGNGFGATNGGSSGAASGGSPSGLGAGGASFTPPPPSPQYPINRAPLQASAFLALPIGSVRARGWLLKQMQLQAAGLSGHAEHIYQENGPTNQWLGGTGDNWERGPYYVRAATALAYVLDDATLKGNVRKWIDWAVASQTADGNFGPTSLDPDDWWPRMLMLRAVEDAHEATGEKPLLDFLGRYFTYQANHPTRGSDTWSTFRMQDDAQVALYAYNRLPSLPQATFVPLFDGLRAATEDWIGDFNAKSLAKGDPGTLRTQNVNVAMALKAPAVYWQKSGVDSDRSAYATGLDFILRENNQPEGMPSGDERLSGSGSTEGVELCGIVDAIASHAYSMLVLGQPTTGDLLEKIAFNALASSSNKTMTGIDYYSIPNEPEAIKGTSKFPQDYSNGMTMSWQSGFPCCRFNWHMGWPRFTQATWAATADGGLAALVYSPTVVTAKVAGGQSVSIIEDTNYPFEEQVRFTLRTGSPAGFPLTVRIPGWATNASIVVNGQSEAGPISAGSLHTIANRVWNDGDTVALDIPMPISTSAQINGSVSVHRGPLVYSLQIGESWHETTPNTVDGVDFGEYEVKPTTAWNYALSVDATNVASSFQVVKRAMPENPFAQATTPVVLQAKGRAIPGWGLRTDAVLAQEVPASPVQAPGPDVSLTLVPFGAETLRISEFPVLASAQSQAMIEKRSGAFATTLVELYAPWCAACAAVSRNLDAAEARLGGRAQVVRIDVDRDPEAALRWDVDALPAFLVLKGGQALARHVGLASADELVHLVRDGHYTR